METSSNDHKSSSGLTDSFLHTGIYHLCLTAATGLGHVNGMKILEDLLNDLGIIPGKAPILRTMEQVEFFMHITPNGPPVGTFLALINKPWSSYRDDLFKERLHIFWTSESESEIEKYVKDSLWIVTANCSKKQGMPFVLNENGEAFLRHPDLQVLSIAGLLRSVHVSAGSAKELYELQKADMARHYSDAKGAAVPVCRKPTAKNGKIFETIQLPITQRMMDDLDYRPLSGGITMHIHCGRTTMEWICAKPKNIKVKGFAHGQTLEEIYKQPLIEETKGITTQSYYTPFRGMGEEYCYATFGEKGLEPLYGYGHLTGGEFKVSKENPKRFVATTTSALPVKLDRKIMMPLFQSMNDPKHKMNDHYNSTLVYGPHYPRGNYGPILDIPPIVIAEAVLIFLDAIRSRARLSDADDGDHGLRITGFIEDGSCYLCVPFIDKSGVPITISGSSGSSGSSGNFHGGIIYIRQSSKGDANPLFGYCTSIDEDGSLEKLAYKTFVDPDLASAKCIWNNVCTIVDCLNTKFDPDGEGEIIRFIQQERSEGVANTAYKCIMGTLPYTTLLRNDH